MEINVRESQVGSWPVKHIELVVRGEGNTPW
jgi:hypothetical protein